ncbi:hypothetical protein M514_03086 [Trichuris suis]|uniref:Uncharacterized protein n=1 Tax=Trichuris suis TaxID=68888 RepID=A0A085NFN5_9BILA|nr:hypothetical protein M513_03086 [Trichuris suis]KFD68281.1 hypothetical protein M514_03086 [Trichuris suis]
MDRFPYLLIIKTVITQEMLFRLVVEEFISKEVAILRVREYSEIARLVRSSATKGFLWLVCELFIMRSGQVVLSAQTCLRQTATLKHYASLCSIFMVNTSDSKGGAGRPRVALDCSCMPMVNLATVSAKRPTDPEQKVVLGPQTDYAELTLERP